MSYLQDIDLGNYDLITDFQLDSAPVHVIKLRSRRTGLQVVLGQHKGQFFRAPFL